MKTVIIKPKKVEIDPKLKNEINSEKESVIITLRTLKLLNGML